MKNYLLEKIIIVLLLLSLFTMSLSAQSLVSTQTTKRAIIFEEFTGINCGYCPQGHEIVTELEEEYGDQLIPINIHASSLAIPSGSQPDLRYDLGEALFIDLGGYSVPLATADRIPLSFLGGNIMMERQYWKDVVAEVANLDSPVNLGMETTFDPVSRLLTVVVELYYTGPVPVTNRINVAFLESNLIASQQDYTNGFQPNYEHNHILRHLLTDQWGVLVNTNSNFVTQTFSYTVPEEYPIENCQVVAFVSEGATNIYTAKKVAAAGGSTLVVADLEPESEFEHFNTALGELLTVDFDAASALAGTESFTVSLTAEDAPSEWEGTLMVNGTEYTSNQAVLNWNDGVNQDISINVLPCAEAGLATYTVNIASNANPAVPVVSQTFEVISGVRDILMSNSGSASFYEIVYTGLMAFNPELEWMSLTQREFIHFQNAGAADEILNVYYNVGWTYPPFSDETVGALSNYLDEGGNLFIAGQDIGYYLNEPFYNPTTAAYNFYTNYMHASFLNNGSSSDNLLSFDVNDAWFGNVGSSPIFDVYVGDGSGISPDDFQVLGPAVPIVTYNNGSKIGGLRVETSTYKLVYLGVGLDQYDNQNIANNALAATIDWFYNGVVVEPVPTECTASHAVLNTKVFLQGAYEGGGLMDDLISDEFLTNQPYNTAPWYYDGSENLSEIPSNVIDWVLVEARTGTPTNNGNGTTIVEQRAGLLLENGDIVDTDGSSGLSFFNLEMGQDYYISIRHRNHLDILSANAITGSTQMTYDFTTSVSQAYGNQQQEVASDGKAMLFAGDINADVLIQSTDYDQWFVNNAVLNTYLPADLNLDGVIQTTDYDLWFANKAKVGVLELQY